MDPLATMARSFRFGLKGGVKQVMVTHADVKPGYCQLYAAGCMIVDLCC